MAVLLYFGLVVIFFQRAPDLPPRDGYTGIGAPRQLVNAVALLFMALTLLPIPTEVATAAVDALI